MLSSFSQLLCVNFGSVPTSCRRRVPLGLSGARPTDLLAAFFACAIVFLLAALTALVIHALTGSVRAHWLALHLAFVGGVSQLVLGAGQFFAGAFLATGPPPRRLVRAQLATWNTGALLIAIGAPTGADPAVWAGAALLASGLVLFVAGLFWLRRHSVQRIPWAVRWYWTAAAFLGIGVLAGVGLATGARWPAGDLLGTHLALNLGGWFGTAIVGTLHTFYPSLTHTRLRWPRLQVPTFSAWTAGIGALAAGAAIPFEPLVGAGWAALLLASALLGANLMGCTMQANERLSLAARLVGTGQAFLIGALLLANLALLRHGHQASLSGGTRTLLAALLIPGWLGFTVLGSLHHLLGVLVRVRDLRRPTPAPRPARDRAVATLAALGAAFYAATRSGALDSLKPGAEVLLALAYAALGLPVLVLAGRAIRLVRPRI
jgi:nitrite reductase (NO-forming)